MSAEQPDSAAEQPQQSTPQRAESRPSGSQQRSGLTPVRTAVAVVIAALIAWAGIALTPPWFTTPEELLGVDMYSPAELQQAAAEKEVELYWKNGLVVSSFLGFCFGLVPGLLAFTVGTRRPALPAVVGIVAGIVAGILVLVVGTWMRALVDSGAELPLIGNVAQALVGDVLVLGLVGLLLGLPITAGIALMGVPGAGEKAGAAPMAGLLAGMLTPLLASLVISEQSTSEFPVTTPSLLAIWLGLFAVCLIAFTTALGNKSATPESQPAATE